MIPRAEFFDTTNDPNGEPVSTFGFVLSDPAPQQKPTNESINSNPGTIKKAPRLAFQSKSMNEMVRLATRYAKSSAAVMITGESGTGKELFSRLIHDQSHRTKNRFVPVNCAAIPEQLIESEIFGHERGAFTGATQRRSGYFERADGGTLLLDEISEIPVALQAKLLRAIEEQEIQPIGSEHPISIDVRIVATSNRNLKTEVAEGRFRDDLYHRLNVLELPLPALRDRSSDIPLLIVHFLEQFQSESEQKIQRINRDAMQQLCQYSWPGNVRELRNVMHRSCIVATENEITIDCLPNTITHPEPLKPPSEINPFFGRRLEEVERILILACLNKYQGNKLAAAAELGVTARTLNNKVNRYREEGHACSW